MVNLDRDQNRITVATTLPACPDWRSASEWRIDAVPDPDGIVVRRYPHTLRPTARRENQAHRERIALFGLQRRVARRNRSPTLGPQLIAVQLPRPPQVVARLAIRHRRLVDEQIAVTRGSKVT